MHLKDICGMLEAKDNMHKSIPLSDNSRDNVLDTYAGCQQRNGTTVMAAQYKTAKYPAV